MDVLVVLLKSLLIGGLVGFAAGAGAARMFHAPSTQGLGAFRTLGEMNACEGDAASHFSFGLGFFFNAGHQLLERVHLHKMWITVLFLTGQPLHY